MQYVFGSLSLSLPKMNFLGDYLNSVARDETRIRFCRATLFSSDDPNTRIYTNDLADVLRLSFCMK